MNERQISVDDMARLQAWVRSRPAAPDGPWYKDVGSFKLCGSGEHPLTVLAGGMAAYGQEIR